MLKKQADIILKYILMSKRYNHYHVKIDFDKKRPECNIGNLYSEYMSGKTNKDSFHFLSNSFTLIASRSKMFVDGTILSNSTNSINSQLLKGLLYYYSLAKDFPNIKQISIIRKRAKSIDFNYKECTPRYPRRYCRYRSGCRRTPAH